jgi:hypothetical protein
MKLRTILVSGLVVASISTSLYAQDNSATTVSDHDLIQQLQQRIEQLEKQMQERDGQQCAAQPQNAPEAPATSSTAQPASTPQPDTATSAQAQPSSMENMEKSPTMPQLRIRGYADVGFVASQGAPPPENHSTFAIGQFNLFMTSQISPRAGVLAELVVEPGQDNAVGVDLERLLFHYSVSDSLNVSVGRYHTSIGYYNTAYHHSSWMQTAVGRPFLFQFEDDGGILPIHNVGLSISGKVPSGGLGLHYVAEMGNGRTSRSRLDEAVQNAMDENNRKALNLALFVRPERFSGLQAGFSYYLDRLSPDASSLFQNPANPFPASVAANPRIDERILAVHAVYQNTRFEFLNEGLLVQHALEGYRTFHTPGFYTQVSRRWGPLWPYFRYQYVNANTYEPVFGDVGLRHGPSVGMRFDINESAAFKLQYDRTMQRDGGPINGMASQVSFRF